MNERWRLQIEHRTTFRYEGKVRTSFNEARLTPLTGPHQYALGTTLTIRPHPLISRYTDYWGSAVTSFDLHEPHDTLEVVARSTAESVRPDPGPDADAAGWEVLRDDAVRDRWCELLAPTGRTEVDAELQAVAAEMRAGKSPAETAQAIADWVRQEVAYRPGSTGVQTAAMEAYHQRSGVCQDLAHLTIGMVRSVGIPARYVSGYLHPAADATVGTPYEGESHAWVEWWTGAWCGVDPTSGRAADERHVVVARGRDYTDVAPLKGIFVGAPSRGLEVAVAITRV